MVDHMLLNTLGEAFFSMHDVAKARMFEKGATRTTVDFDIGAQVGPVHFLPPVINQATKDFTNALRCCVS